MPDPCQVPSLTVSWDPDTAAWVVKIGRPFDRTCSIPADITGLGDKLSAVPGRAQKVQQKSPYPHICGDPPVGIQRGSSMCSACNWELGYIAAVHDVRDHVADL